jgi:hypothetical protein
MILSVSVRVPRLMLLALFVGGGCGAPPMGPPDGGVPLKLEIIGQSQLPLPFGAPVLLQVRLHADDSTKQPVPSSPVRFSIFGDPAGSTLSSDVAVTDVNGLAQVTLTTGQAAAEFRVAATAQNAPEVDFNIGVSKNGFVEIDAQLSWTIMPPAGTLRAQLFDTINCAALPPSNTAPVQYIVRTGASPGEQPATFQWVALQQLDYAVVGRAEDPSGKLIGYGCVDLPMGLAPLGTVSMVPVPLSPTQSSPVGVFTLTTMLQPTMAMMQPVLTPWKQLGGCTYGAAQAILDGIEQAAPASAAAIEAHRDPPVSGCRPVSTTSLDDQLQNLIMTPMAAPAKELPYISDDIASIVSQLTVISQLNITAAGGGTFAGEHTLVTATVTLGPNVKTYTLAPFGLPIIDVKDIPISYDGAILSIGSHGFTLGFAPLWGQALSDQSLTVRVPSLGMAPLPIGAATHALVAAIVASVSRSGKMGCAAVEDLICSAIGSPCSLQAACTSAIDTVSNSLDAPFAPPPGLDLAWKGSAAATDSTAMLLIDMLTSGTWTSRSLAMGTFTGMRAP